MKFVNSLFCVFVHDLGFEFINTNIVDYFLTNKQ
jgi:hypothetical protein